MNESFYNSTMARNMGLPIWNEITVNPITRTLTFNDTTSDYYMALTYYDNGTLEKAEFSVEFNIDGNIIEFNLKTIRKDDYNHTDKIEWGVEVGDSYYFGSNFPMGGPTIEVNITIVDINETAVFLRDMIFGDDENGDDGGPPMFQSWLTFSNVWAKIEVWNVTRDVNGIETGKWLDLIDIDDYANETIIIAAANLTINYNEWELYNSGIPEDKIKVYLFNESKKFNESEWIELIENVNYTRDILNNKIEIYNTHLSIFAIGTPEEWNWSSEINIGDEMYYETTGKLAGNLSEEMGIVNMPFVDFYILNVTNIGLSYKDRGDGEIDWMNQINCNLLYWDPAVKDLVKFDDAGEFILSEYNYNSSFDPQFYLNLTEHSLGFPIAVPLRFKKLHLMSIGVALNESFYNSTMARNMG
ncbi:unnamed protein product, partial [marine sediment metagenome]